jgi:uncharacterized RDD family membrane protein YckC
MSEPGGVWGRRSNDDLVEAARHLDEYTDEGHRVIRAELLRRGLPVPASLQAGREPERPAPEPPHAYAQADAHADARAEDLASLSDRLGGQIVDSVVAILVVAVSALPAIASERVGNVTLACGLVVGMSYLLFADGFPGQSYGHRLTKTAVVHATTGAPCTFAQSFIRNLPLTALGVLDWVFIFGKRRQRLGDMAAKTIVINIAPRVSPPARSE